MKSKQGLKCTRLALSQTWAEHSYSPTRSPRSQCPTQPCLDLGKFCHRKITTTTYHQKIQKYLWRPHRSGRVSTPASRGTSIEAREGQHLFPSFAAADRSYRPCHPRLLRSQPWELPCCIGNSDRTSGRLRHARMPGKYPCDMAGYITGILTHAADGCCQSSSTAEEEHIGRLGRLGVVMCFMSKHFRTVYYGSFLSLPVAMPVTTHCLILTPIVHGLQLSSRLQLSCMYFSILQIKINCALNNMPLSSPLSCFPADWYHIKYT